MSEDPTLNLIEMLSASGGYRLEDGVLVSNREPNQRDRLNTDAFYEKWSWTHHRPGADAYEAMQYQRYLSLYGFSDEEQLARFLSNKTVIFDAGCGYGHKSNWFAEMAPHATIVSMDLSDSVRIAHKLYSHRKNIIFIKGDIANTGLPDACFDYVSCDQVLHHTTDPAATVHELVRLSRAGGHIALYVYARKALPRELLDEYFLSKQIELSTDEIWDLSARLTELGRMLYELDIELDFQDIPQLGIKGGRKNIQRFIYENFIKCYWNSAIGREQSNAVNFDWYSPHIAHRFSVDEFLDLTTRAGLVPVYRYSEPACHSGMFVLPA